MFIPEDNRVPTGKFAQLIGQNSPFYSRFRGLQSNYAATDNVLNHFKYFWIYFIRQSLKIQTRIFGKKIEKKQGVPLAFFSIFSSKNFV